jgi:transketolase C-terminal domain/subunit
MFSIEEHLKDSGLGSMLRNIYALEKIKIISFGVDRDICHEVGNQNYLRKIHGIDSESIVVKIKDILNK